MLQDVSQRMAVAPLANANIGPAAQATPPSPDSINAFNSAMNAPMDPIADLGGNADGGHGAGCSTTADLVGQQMPTGFAQSSLDDTALIGQGMDGLPAGLGGLQGPAGNAALTGQGMNGAQGLDAAPGANGTDDAFATLAGDDQILQPEELLAAVQGIAGQDGVFDQQEFVEFASALGINDPQAGAVLFDVLSEGTGSVPADSVVQLANASARPDGTWGRDEFNNVLMSLAEVLASSLDATEQGAVGGAGAPASNPQTADALQGGLAPDAPQTAAAPNPLLNQPSFM